ncbi:GGDEF domain-containing protein [Terracidiphilus gabretensis]|uniref:GGDEF domain-containing protein n=1 Tax=Terracidiphilus gabretensis TaxID=1577687 RepID=UPI00071BB20A|nr:GGDEF domain-containing protein [Terracidiphilus gabretensis]
MEQPDEVMPAAGASSRLYWGYAASYLLIGIAHLIALTRQSDAGNVASDVIVGVAQWLTLAALIWRWRRSSFPDTFRWGATIAALAFINLANDNDLVIHVGGNYPHAPGASIFCDAIYVALVLLSCSTTFRGRTMRATNLVDAAMVVALTGFFFVRTFSLVSISGPDDANNVLFIIRMFNILGIFLTLCAAVRLLGAERTRQRHFFFVLTAYLLTSTAFAAVRNPLTIKPNGMEFDFLLLPQFIVLGLLCLRGSPRWLESYQPRSSLVDAAESLSPLFLGLGLLGVSLSIFSSHPVLGVVGASIAVIGYGIRNVITQSEQMATERSLMLLQGELQTLAVTDPLTGITNRRGFDASLGRMWKRVETSDMHLSVLIIDIDHFKLFNDSYGHDLGDLCLIAVANCLRDILTPLGCSVARNGGEEFAALLPAATFQQAMEIGETIRQSISEVRVSHGNEPLLITVSIGVANSAQSQASSAKALLLIADKALYDAKSAGRNRVVYRDSIDAS